MLKASAAFIRCAGDIRLGTLFGSGMNADASRPRFFYRLCVLLVEINRDLLGDGSSPQPSQRSIDRVHVEAFRIEHATAPGEHLAMVIVSGIAQCGEELRVPADAADILWWAGSRARDAQRVVEPRIWLKRPLDTYLVLPVVSEVVDVAQRLPFANELVELHLLLVLQLHLAVLILARVADSAVADLEHVQVGERPSHGFLQRRVQLGERDVRGYEEAPPDGRLDFLEGHPELEDAVCSFGLARHGNRVISTPP